MSLTKDDQIEEIEISVKELDKLQKEFGMTSYGYPASFKSGVNAIVVKLYKIIQDYKLTATT